MLWILFGLMCLVAIGFAIRPLLKDLPRLNALTGLSVVLVSATAGGVYYLTGSPDVPSGRSEVGAPSDDLIDMVEALAARLEQDPDDLNGWMMLGRSYMAMSNFGAAVNAFERAVELEDAGNANTLVSLGVALVQAGGQQQLSPRAISVFENAITLDPNHQEGLFWAGIAAFNRGDSTLAADRWERLLATEPPPEIRALLEQRIAEWRGEPPPVQAVAPTEAPEQEGTVVRAAITVSDTALAALPGNSTVFVIARDPQQPSPPIAVVRRQLSEFPIVVNLGDGNSMVPGRFLSGFAEFELLARVSVSGTPVAQSGDWFGSAIVRPAELSNIDLAIDQQVP